MRKKELTVAGLVLFSLLAVSCSSTRVTASWKDPAYTGTIKSVMVIGVHDDMAKRRLFEDDFSKAFNEKGIRAVASATRPGLQGMPRKDGTFAVEIQKLGLSHAVVTHLVGVDEREVYHPPSTQVISTGYAGGYGGYYHATYQMVTTPGYYTSHKYVMLETKIFDAKTKKVVWAISSETMDPTSANQLIASLAKTVVKDLKRQALLGK